MISLKQLVPEKMCLSCQGCCRYAQQSSSWSPLFMFEEIEELVSKNQIPCMLFSRAGLHGGEATRINLVKHGDSFFCPCFDEYDNKCKIYPLRPFDCQLYPFLLVKKGKDAYLAIDKNCPYAGRAFGKEEMRDHIQYLLSFLESRDFLNLAKNNPEIVQKYGEDVEFLSPLPELSQAIYATLATHPKR